MFGTAESGGDGSALSAVLQFVMADMTFIQKLEAFSKEHAHLIGDPDKEEHSHAAFELFNDYQKLFETLIGGYLESKGHTAEKLYEEMLEKNARSVDLAHCLARGRLQQRPHTHRHTHTHALMCMLSLCLESLVAASTDFNPSSSMPEVPMMVWPCLGRCCSL